MQPHEVNWRFDQFAAARRRPKLRAAVRNKTFSIVACNCWGTEVYKDLDLPYRTPFIGLYLRLPCFLDFLENFDEAIRAPLEFIEESRYIGAQEYPIGLLLGRIEIHFMHYDSREEAFEKWNRRRERINPDPSNRFYVLTRRPEDDVEDLLRFVRLPLPNKLLFLQEPLAGAPDAIVVPPKNPKDPWEDALAVYRRCHDYFSLPRWLDDLEALNIAVASAPSYQTPSTWLIDATRDFSALPAVSAAAASLRREMRVVHRREDAAAIRSLIPEGNTFVHPVEAGEPSSFGVGAEGEVRFLPCSARIDWREQQQTAPLSCPGSVQMLFAQPERVLSKHIQREPPVAWFGWRASAAVALRMLREPSLWDGDHAQLADTIQSWPDRPRWLSSPLDPFLWEAPGDPGADPVLTPRSRILAVIPFHRCEEWLSGCLASITGQSRPPENIVVIDDCSPALPLDLLEPFPNVTLLQTTRNVGPEKILNNIIKATDYDAYMLQDADDWSSYDRLALFLREAERTAAELVGTHELRIDFSKKSVQMTLFPPDVNHAMRAGEIYSILHGGCLISRALALKVGGFDENLKLTADREFVMRAWHAGRIVNTPHFCFFRRIRRSSLTTQEDTGHYSKARMIEERFTDIRAIRNLERLKAGLLPTFSVRQKQPVEFVYHRGPKLRLSTGPEAALSTISGM